MSDVTLKAIAQVVQKQLEPINTQLAAIKETVSKHTDSLKKILQVQNSHTASLDGIAKNVKDLNLESKAVGQRADKHEKAINLLAKKISLSEEVEKIIHS